MTEIEKAAKEYEKCKNDPYYFFKTYCTVKKKTEMTIRETLEGKEFEEVANIFLKYFTEDRKREHYSTTIKLIERVTHEDGEVCFVLSFRDIWYDVSMASIDYDDNYLGLLRKEKLDKLCQSLLQK
jgi:hypothetical protein